MTAPLISLDRGTVAVVTEDGALGYGELRARVDGLASRIPDGSVVFILNRNDLPSLTGLLACLNCGAVPLMLDAGIGADRLDALVSAYAPDFIWRPGADGYGLEASGSGRFGPPHPDLAMLLATSGSTGSPKLVRLSRRNVMANVANHVDCLGLRSDDCFVASLPMDHTYGLSMTLSVLSSGGRVLLTGSSIVERRFWDFFTDNGVTVFGGVPHTYEMLDRLMFFRRKLPSLRLMTSAGGRLRDDIHRKFAEYAAHEGKEFVVMYGQSEATAAMAYLPARDALAKVGSAGVPIPGGRLSLADDGELLYEGANVSMGYALSGEDLSKGDERGGRLETGDLARMDADGFYTIIGRKSRFLKLQGNRIGLDETERLVCSAFPGLECACAGDDLRMLIRLAGPGAEERVDSVRRLVSERTRLSLALFDVRCLSQIPRNAAGKTLYSELK